MPNTMTLAEAQAKREKDIEGNRELGVVEWDNGQQPLADAVYEVVEGYHGLPGHGRIGPGHRFRPTVAQHERQTLRNKARELTSTEYRGIHRHERKPVVSGADIGLRRFPMAEGTLSFALASGLTEEDFQAVEPEGSDGRFTRAQVDQMVRARA